MNVLHIFFIMFVIISLDAMNQEHKPPLIKPISRRQQENLNKKLEEAVLSKTPDVVVQLINKGAKVDHICDYEKGTTLLIMTAIHNRKDTMKVLLENRADLHIVTQNSSTQKKINALNMAAKHGHVDCMQLLIEHKAGPFYFNNSLKSAFSISILNNHCQCFEFLLKYAEEIDANLCNPDVALPSYFKSLPETVCQEILGKDLTFCYGLEKTNHFLRLFLKQFG